MDKETRSSDKIRRWVTGIMAQAVNPVAADATRPFVVDSLRLAAQHPEESMRSEERLRAPLRAALGLAVSAGELPSADPLRDAEAVYYLTMGTMQGYLVRAEVPTAGEIERLSDFVISGLTRHKNRKGGRRGA